MANIFNNKKVHIVWSDKLCRNLHVCQNAGHVALEQQVCCLLIYVKYVSRKTLYSRINDNKRMIIMTLYSRIPDNKRMFLIKCAFAIVDGTSFNEKWFYSVLKNIWIFIIFSLRYIFVFWENKNSHTKLSGFFLININQERKYLP